MAWLVKAGRALGIAGTADRDPDLVAGRCSAAADRIDDADRAAARPSSGLVMIAGLAAALSPLTQFLHGVGQIDHHFAEYIFVLATIACGLRWFSRPDDTQAAIIAGRRARCRAGDSQRPVHPAGAGARSAARAVGCRTSACPCARRCVCRQHCC